MTALARTPRQLGSEIRRARRRLGLTQTQLANKTCLRQETISLIENGNPATRLDTILGVLAALELELLVAIRSRGDASDIEDIF